MDFQLKKNKSSCFVRHSFIDLLLTIVSVNSQLRILHTFQLQNDLLYPQL